MSWKLRDVKNLEPVKKTSINYKIADLDNSGNVHLLRRIWNKWKSDLYIIDFQFFHNLERKESHGVCPYEFNFSYLEKFFGKNRDATLQYFFRVFILFFFWYFCNFFSMFLVLFFVIFICKVSIQFFIFFFVITHYTQNEEFFFFRVLLF